MRLSCAAARPDIPEMRTTAARPDAQAQIAGLIFAVLLVDQNHRIAEANHAAEVLFERSAKRIVGQDLFEVLRIDDDRLQERLGESDEQLIARGIPLRVGPSGHVANITASPLAGFPGWRVLTISDARTSEGDVEDLRMRLPRDPHDEPVTLHLDRVHLRRRQVDGRAGHPHGRSVVHVSS